MIQQTKYVSKITSSGEKLLAVTLLYESVKVHNSASAYLIAVYFVFLKNVFIKPRNYNIRWNLLWFHDENEKN